MRISMSMSLNGYYCMACIQRKTSCLASKRASFSKVQKQFSHCITKTRNPFEAGITDVVDVRTNREYIADHIPFAVNLPVLTEHEHVHVGTVYSQDSFQARKTGAQMVSRNISRHIGDYFQGKGEDCTPLVYCARGGQRSRSLALVLSEIGFHTYTLIGGYKTYRHVVMKDIETLPFPLEFRVVSGFTGTGKTHLLHQLQVRGEQILDLEGLAVHKGSLLGMDYHQEDQPSQRFFESLLRQALSQLDPSKPVWVESESRRIGRMVLPPTLFSRMRSGRRYTIVLPLTQRVQHLMAEYPHWTTDVEALMQLIGPLVKFHGKKKLAEWTELIRQNRFEEFVEDILVGHYDPCYRRSQDTLSAYPQVEVPLRNLDSEAVQDAITHMLCRET